MTDPHTTAEEAAANTDREIWRKGDGDGNGMSYYEPSIHVTEQGLIGINVGGLVFEKPVEEWHRLAAELASVRADLDAAEARVRELEAALQEIAVVDAEECHFGDGWRCVDYLQTKARAALNKEDVSACSCRKHATCLSCLTALGTIRLGERDQRRLPRRLGHRLVARLRLLPGGVAALLRARS